MGGALATISAVSLQFSDLPSEWKPTMEVFTLGSPQVGSRNFVNLFNRVISVSTRAANPIDIVPRVLDGVLFHVKGFLPTISFFTQIGKAHNSATYSNAIRNWNLPRVVLFTALPFLLGASIIIVLYYLIKVGADYHTRRSLLSAYETPTIVQKLRKFFQLKSL